MISWQVWKEVLQGLVGWPPESGLAIIRVWLAQVLVAVRDLECLRVLCQHGDQHMAIDYLFCDLVSFNPGDVIPPLAT